MSTHNDDWHWPFEGEPDQPDWEALRDGLKVARQNFDYTGEDLPGYAIDILRLAYFDGHISEAERVRQILCRLGQIADVLDSDAAPYVRERSERICSAVSDLDDIPSAGHALH